MWALFGVLVHAADGVLHSLVDQSGWLQAHPWVLAAGTLLAVGLYQFSPLKYVCLERCRTPRSSATASGSVISHCWIRSCPE